MPHASSHARANQRQAVKASEQRAARAAKAATAAAWQAIGSVLTEDVLAAIEAGETGKAQELLRRPATTAVLPVVKRAAKDGWEAGLKEGKKALRDVFGERFDDLTAARRAELARRAARAEQHRPTGPEAKQAREQARAFLKSFMSHVKDQVGDELASARGKADPAKAFRDARDTLESIKGGGELSPTARRFVRGVEKRADRVLATPLLEVDWAASRRAETVPWKHAPEGDGVRILIVEFAATMDDSTTPACNFLDGATMLPNDKRMDRVRPGIHYRCRSKFVARMGTRDELTWDERISKVIGEPRAGAEQQRSYTLRPSQIKVPLTAPNVAPPRHLAEWVG